MTLPDDRHRSGTLGTEIVLRSNFFLLDSFPMGIIFKYEIAINPKVPPNKNRRIYDMWMHAHGGSCHLQTVYDGNNLLYSTALFPDDEVFIGSHEDSIHHEDYQVNVRKVKDIDMNNLRLYLNGEAKSVPVEEIHVVETLLQHASSNLYKTRGKCFYFSDTALKIDHGLELWQGVFSKIQPTDGALLINLDVSAGAFHQSGSLLDTAVSVLELKSILDLRAPLTEKQRLDLETFLKDIKINVTHRGKFRKKYTIYQLSVDGANTISFLKNGSSDNQTVTEYFSQRYHIELKYGHLPCVIYKCSSGVAYIPMEVCTIVPGQHYSRRLNETQVGNDLLN